jgi:hypothetical protein
MITKITKAQYPDIWSLITDDWQEESYSAHRRGSNFFKRYIYRIDMELLPGTPELWGHWETDTLISDAEYGGDTDINNLTRVKEAEETITRKVWLPFS